MHFHRAGLTWESQLAFQGCFAAGSSTGMRQKMTGIKEGHIRRGARGDTGGSYSRLG